MILPVTETNLLTFKSQLPLNQDDVIAIRDTVDDSVSIGINTIGDFDSYYISSSSPTFGQTFLGEDNTLTSNILGSQYGETQTNSVSIASAYVTLQQYQSEPLIINGATAYLTESYTPEINPQGATLTYSITNPFSVTSASLNLSVTKVYQNMVTKIEIKPTIAVKYMTSSSVQYGDRGCGSSPRFTTVNVPLDWVDVTSYYDISNIKATDEIKLPIFFQGNDEKNGLGPCILTPKIHGGFILVPLYYQYYGKLRPNFYYKPENIEVFNNYYNYDSSYRNSTSTGQSSTMKTAAFYYSGQSMYQYFYDATNYSSSPRVFGSSVPTKTSTTSCSDYPDSGSDFRYMSNGSSYDVKVTLTDGRSYVVTGRTFSSQMNTIAEIDNYSFLGLSNYTSTSQKSYMDKECVLEIYSYENNFNVPKVESDNDIKRTSRYNPIYYTYYNTYQDFPRVGPVKTGSVDYNTSGYYGKTFDPTHNCLAPSNTVIKYTDVGPNAVQSTYGYSRNVSNIDLTRTISACSNPRLGINLTNIRFNANLDLIGENSNNGNAVVTLINNASLISNYESSTSTTTLVQDEGDLEFPVGSIVLSTSVGNVNSLIVGYKTGLATGSQSLTITVQAPTTLLVTNSNYERIYTVTGITLKSNNSPTTENILFSDYFNNFFYSNITSVNTKRQNVVIQLGNSNLFIEIENSSKYFNLPITGEFGGATLSYSYNFTYNLPSGLTLSSGSTANTAINNNTIPFTIVLRPNAPAYNALVNIENPSVYAVDINEVIPLTKYFNNIIQRNTQSIEIPRSYIRDFPNRLYPGVTYTYPLLSGYLEVDGFWQGSGTLVEQSFPIISNDHSLPSIAPIIIVNTGDSTFRRTLSLPQTFNVTEFLNSQIVENILSIPMYSVEYDANGDIPALGISAAQLQYCVPDLSTLVYDITFQVGSEYYYTRTNITGGVSDNSNIYIAPDISSTNKTLFNMIDREKRFTVNEIDAGITILYFTTISKNASGYTFTETPFLINNLSSDNVYNYKIYNAPLNGLITSNGSNTNVSRLLDINNPLLNRTNLSFNSVGYPIGEIPIDPAKQTLLNTVCALSESVDPQYALYNIDSFQMSSTGISGTILNNFFVYDYTYTLEDSYKTYSLYLFVTPIIPANIVPPIVIPPAPIGPTGTTGSTGSTGSTGPTGPPPIPIPPPLQPVAPPPPPPNYPFWMQAYTQNSNGSITGIPTLDTSYLQNTPFEGRLFNGITTLSADYCAPPISSFSINIATNGNYLVGNSYSSLYSLAGTTASSTTVPFDGVAGIPQDLIDGFANQDYRYTSKYFSITTDKNKQLYVLPFNYYKIGNQYNISYQNNIIVYIKCDVNASDSVPAVWPVSITNTAQGFNTSQIKNYGYSYNVPSPNIVSNGLTTYCPTIDAQPGYINIFMPYQGLYIKNTSAPNGDINFYTPNGGVLYSGNGRAYYQPLDSTNPSFFIKYLNSEYTPLFQKGSTGFTITLTGKTATTTNDKTFQSYLYSGQIYNDMVIQPLLNSNYSRITKVSNANYLSGGFQLPRFYMPKGLELNGIISTIITGISITQSLGTKMQLTINLNNSSNFLTFAGTRIVPAEPLNIPRFAIATTPSVTPTLSPVKFDITSTSNSVILSGLLQNTTYTGLALTYYPYLDNSNLDIRDYYEKINLTGVSFTTPAGNDLTGSVSLRQLTGQPRQYSLTVSNIRINNDNTVNILGTGYTLVIDVKGDSVKQPFIKNITFANIKNTNFSNTGVLRVSLSNSLVLPSSNGFSATFNLTNLEDGITYIPTVYLIGPDSSISNSLPRVPTPIVIPVLPNISLQSSIITNLTTNLTIDNFNVYDSLVETDFSLPSRNGGSIYMINDLTTGPMIDYGKIMLQPSIYPKSVSININKNLLPNTQYNLYAAYNPLEHVSNGWNQYNFTELDGNRSLAITRSESANYLLNTLIPTSTPMTYSQGLSLAAFLGPSAVMYGSSILYSYYGITGLTGAGDIDIMVNDTDVLNNLVQYIYGAVGGTIFDGFGLYSGSTAGLTYSNNHYIAPISGGQPSLVSSSAPTGSSYMGELNVAGVNVSNDSNNVEMYIDDKYRTLTILPNTTNTPNIPFQIAYVNPNAIPPNFTLAEYAQFTSDFTINAGTFDGTNLVIPYPNDIATKTTVYREVITNKHKWRMLRRLDKYKKRGFKIFFESQKQIDDWNALEVSSDPSVDLWWYNRSTTNPKTFNTCPFRVLNKLYVIPQPYSPRTRISIGADTLVAASIRSSQPCLGGILSINGFDYTRFGVYSVPTNIGGTITVTNPLGTVTYGTLNINAGVYPQNLSVSMTNAFISAGSTPMVIRFSWDSPVQIGSSTLPFVYTAIDSILPAVTVTPLIHKILIQLPIDSILGGNVVSECNPTLKYTASPNFGPTFQGGYTIGVTYPPYSLVTENGYLYMLTGPNTGDPEFGNGWDNTTGNYFFYSGEWTSKRYNKGQVVTYNNMLYECTADQSIIGAPGEFNINTGVPTPWTTDVSTHSVIANNNGVDFLGIIENCIPNTNYSVYLQYQVGNTFSPPQLVSNTTTLPDVFVVDSVIPVPTNSYNIRKIHYDGSTDMFSDGYVITNGGNVYIPSPSIGITVSSFNPLAGNPSIRYQPQISVDIEVQDSTSPFYLDYLSFIFSADVVVSDISYNQATITLSNIVSTYAFNTKDSIIITNNVNGNEIELQRIKIGRNLNTSSLTVILTKLSENTNYNSLRAYYVFNGSAQLQNPVFIPQIQTFSQLSYDHVLKPSTLDYSSKFSNFSYVGVTLSSVFPNSGAGQSISINVYNPNSPAPIPKYTPSVDLASITGSSLFTISNRDMPAGVTPSSLTHYDLTYTFINNVGVLETYSRNGLKM